MILYPSLDLIQNKVVRLETGDFAKRTDFSKSAQEWIDIFSSQGATHLHLVDLSGADQPENKQTEFIFDLIKSTKLKMQVGGGIRKFSDVTGLIRLNVDRVVMGSLAFKNPSLTTEIIQAFSPAKITIAVDVKKVGIDYEVMLNAWKESTHLNLFSAIETYISQGISRFLCTDISVDGSMQGPNIELYSSIVSKFPGIELQASGGIASLEHLQMLKQAQLHSCVVGKAILTGAISIKEALKIC